MQRLVAVLLGLGLGLVSCLTPPPHRVGSPDQELKELLESLQWVRGGSFEKETSASAPDRQADDERQILAEIRRQSLVFPRHIPTLVANASLSYEQKDFVGAQRYLDQALSLDSSNVGALLLRVRIAAESGNLPYAKRKLEEQLLLQPGNPDLREAYAGILFLHGEHDAALTQLEMTERLREPEQGAWTTTYHRGLIAETQGDLESAGEYYRLSSEENPDFDPAHQRSTWLQKACLPRQTGEAGLRP